MRTIKLFSIVSILLFVCYNSNANIVKPPATDTLPSLIKGSFMDDYGIRYTLSDTLWLQGSNSRYQIIESDPVNQYIIARNDLRNASDAGLYTRIDYMKFSGMEPFLWGFCYTAYNAVSDTAAKNVRPADRQNPRKGCNGFPFSRMKRM